MKRRSFLQVSSLCGFPNLLLDSTAYAESTQTSFCFIHRSRKELYIFERKNLQVPWELSFLQPFDSYCSYQNAPHVIKTFSHTYFYVLKSYGDSCCPRVLAVQQGGKGEREGFVLKADLEQKCFYVECVLPKSVLQDGMCFLTDCQLHNPLFSYSLLFENRDFLFLYAFDKSDQKWICHRKRFLTDFARNGGFVQRFFRGVGAQKHETLLVEKPQEGHFFYHLKWGDEQGLSLECYRQICNGEQFGVESFHCQSQVNWEREDKGGANTPENSAFPWRSLGTIRVASKGQCLWYQCAENAFFLLSLDEEQIKPFARFSFPGVSTETPLHILGQLTVAQFTESQRDVIFYRVGQMYFLCDWLGGQVYFISLDFDEEVSKLFSCLKDISKENFQFFCVNSFLESQLRCERNQFFSTDFTICVFENSREDVLYDLQCLWFPELSQGHLRLKTRRFFNSHWSFQKSNRGPLSMQPPPPTQDKGTGDFLWLISWVWGGSCSSRAGRNTKLSTPAEHTEFMTGVDLAHHDRGNEMYELLMQRGQEREENFRDHMLEFFRTFKERCDFPPGIFKPEENFLELLYIISEHEPIMKAKISGDDSEQGAYQLYCNESELSDLELRALWGFLPCPAGENPYRLRADAVCLAFFLKQKIQAGELTIESSHMMTKVFFWAQVHSQALL